MDIQHWIDITIATGTIDDMSQIYDSFRKYKDAEKFKKFKDTDRWRRLSKVLPFRKFQLEDWNLLKNFGQACSAWVQVCPILDEYIDKILLGELREAHPLEYTDPDFANILIQQYLFKANARLTSKTDMKKGVILYISAHGLHELTTTPWYRYQLQPKRVQRCGHCGVGYINERLTKFCSSTCRAGSFKKQRKEL